jgi:hypothetical protein
MYSLVPDKLNSNLFVIYKFYTLIKINTLILITDIL